MPMSSVSAMRLTVPVLLKVATPSLSVPTAVLLMVPALLKAGAPDSVLSAVVEVVLMLSTPPTGLLRLPPAAASMPIRSLPARLSVPRLVHGRATVTVPPLAAARSTVVVPVVVKVPLPDRVTDEPVKSAGPLTVKLPLPVTTPPVCKRDAMADNASSVNVPLETLMAPRPDSPPPKVTDPPDTVSVPPRSVAPDTLSVPPDTFSELDPLMVSPVMAWVPDGCATAKPALMSALSTGRGR